MQQFVDRATLIYRKWRRPFELESEQAQAKCIIKAKPASQLNYTYPLPNIYSLLLIDNRRDLPDLSKEGCVFPYLDEEVALLAFFTFFPHQQRTLQLFSILRKQQQHKHVFTCAKARCSTWRKRQQISTTFFLFAQRFLLFLFRNIIQKKKKHRNECQQTKERQRDRF